MFYNADSGLYLTQYRAYDPVAGRWLSRDPIGEISKLRASTPSTSIIDALGSTPASMSSSGVYDGPNASDFHARYYNGVSQNAVGLADGMNLYSYVNDNPVLYSDPTGLVCGFLSCFAECVIRGDLLGIANLPLTIAGGTFPKSLVGLPTAPGTSPFTTIPSVITTVAGGPTAIGRPLRGLGCFASPLWLLYGNYLFYMEIYCAGVCAL
jgi:hypothetical protein